MLKHTVIQINEMQSAMREAAKQIEGSQEYIAKQMEIFRENESLKSAKRLLEKQREEVANSFFENNQAMQNSLNKIQKIEVPHFELDESTKRMIADAVKTSQAIEGYTKVASDQLQKEAARIMKMYDVKVSTHKE